MPVHIVTDSTSDLVPEEAARLGITVVPLTVHFGAEELRDGVDIDAAGFYRRLVEGGVQPTTSQPSPEQFETAYRALLGAEADRVVSIHLSAKLSGTLQSAHLAARDFGGRVACVDSETVSMGMQFLLRAALGDAAGGADLDTVVRRTEARRAQVRVLVLLDTLVYLQRGGRIGRAQALLGGVLNLKPLLRLRDGEAHPQARVRSRQQGVARILELFAAEGPFEALGVMSSGVDAGLGAQTQARLRAAYPELEVHSGVLGPVVGTYTGPGAIGVAGLRVPG